MKGDAYAGNGGVGDVDAADPGVCEDGKIWSPFFATEDWVNVGYAGAAAAAIVRVVGHGEEADSCFQSSGILDFFVEVMDDGDIQSCRAGFYPVSTQLITVTRVNRLYGITEVA